ncbi:MAG: hypothetical protein RLZZ502_584 [Pseudomonadota bacterium]
MAIKKITAEALIEHVHAIVKRMGSNEAEADCVATNLVEANLRGHDSHGVGMMPRYVEAYLEGGLTPNQTLSIIKDTGYMLTCNAGQGFGQTMGREAMLIAIARAKQHGLCALGLHNSHHLGRIGQWAEMAAAENLISIHFVNVLARPIVAPWGGSDARHGTNPFCVAIPRGKKPPIVLDFATSRIAQGKTRVAFNKGEQLPPGILLDHLGKPTTDPRYCVIEPAGAILPFGEHKGSGLALICELLGGALSGGATWHQPADKRRQVLNGMFSILIDAQAAGTAEHLQKEIEAYVSWHTSSPPAGTQTVQIAGEPELLYKSARLKNGIEIDENTWLEINAAAAKLADA